VNASTWATLASSALAFALSPVPLLELILVVMSKRRTVNTIVFVLALVALTAVGVVIGLAGQETTSDEAGTSTGVGVVMLLLGLVLLAVAARNWRNRADTSEPAVLARISEMGPVPVALLAGGATLLNPKNLVVLVAAGQAIAAAGPSGGSAAAVVAVFVLVATLPYTATAVYAVLGGAGAVARLEVCRSWLVGHNRLIMSVVAAVLGLVVLGKGLAAVT